MKTKQEMQVDSWRAREIEAACRFLHGKRLRLRLIEVNLKAADWKEHHQELVKDPIPF